MCEEVERKSSTICKKPPIPIKRSNMLGIRLRKGLEKNVIKFEDFDQIEWDYEKGALDFM